MGWSSTRYNCGLEFCQLQLWVGVLPGTTVGWSSTRYNCGLEFYQVQLWRFGVVPGTAGMGGGGGGVQFYQVQLGGEGVGSSPFSIEDVGEPSELWVWEGSGGGPGGRRRGGRGGGGISGSPFCMQPGVWQLK